MRSVPTTTTTTIHYNNRNKLPSVLVLVGLVGSLFLLHQDRGQVLAFPTAPLVRTSSARLSSSSFSSPTALRIWRSSRPSSPSDKKKNNKKSSDIRHNNNNNNNNDKSNDDPLDRTRLLGVARVIRSVEALKQSQTVGQTTETMFLREQQSSSTNLFVGTAANGRVQIEVDGRHRPCRLAIDPALCQSSSSNNNNNNNDSIVLNDAIVEACRVAQEQSLQAVQEKVQMLQRELGFVVHDNKTNDNTTINDDSSSSLSSSSLEPLQKTTASIAKELEGVVAEGTASDGRIKAVMDGHQRIKSVELDPALVALLKPHELHAEVLEAMGEAHERSKRLAGIRIKSLFVEADMPIVPTTVYSSSTLSSSSTSPVRP